MLHIFQFVKKRLYRQMDTELSKIFDIDTKTFTENSIYSHPQSYYQIVKVLLSYRSMLLLWLRGLFLKLQLMQIKFQNILKNVAITVFHYCFLCCLSVVKLGLKDSRFVLFLERFTLYS